MKSIAELRSNFNLHVIEYSSQLRYLKNLEFDWDVFLPSRNRNLQRELVWTLDQKRELIMSVLLERHIPHFAVINTINRENPNKDIYLVIDGKQRLSTLFDFLDDKFTIELEGSEYLYSALPKEYQLEISCSWIRYYCVNEPWEMERRITDDQKIAWFKLINFAGTPQDKEYLDNLI